MSIRKRQKEAIVYICLWVIVLTLYLVSQFRIRSELNMPLIDMNLFVRMIASVGPFIVLFLINNYLLIPRYLLTNRFGKYILSAFITLSMLMAFQVSTAKYFGPLRPPAEVRANQAHNEKEDVHDLQKYPRPRKHPKPFFPIPFVFDLTYALLIIGGNVAIALVFQRYDDQLEKEKLMKSNAENQLTYLKAQINPHFYMNMLNNIHGMIEIDAEKAQSMVIDMSRLMRYMLYESSKPLTFLDREISFLIDYIELMKLRYDNGIVRISYKFPDGNEAKGINIPPLLFLTFIENAFKHGISYQKESSISISIDLKDNNRLCFRCRNTKHPLDVNSKSGVGLANIRQRLRLLYGDSAELRIHEISETFTVSLSIPYEN